MTAIPVKQRDDFSAWLRSQGMTRVCSHQVARDPGKRWTFIRGGDGYIRAYDRPVAMKNWRSRKDRYTAGTVEVFHVRWKVDPQPGPNSWEGRRWDPYLHRFVYDERQNETAR